MTVIGAQIVLLVKFVLREELLSEFDDLLLETCMLVSRNEPDTLSYFPFVNGNDQRERYLFEVYRDAIAFKRHEKMQYVEVFLEKRQPLILSYEVITGCTLRGMLFGGF